MWVLGVIVIIAVFGPMVWVHDYRTISGARAIAPTFENCTSSVRTCRDET
jgi:oligopeptide transport system permease protein